MKSFVEFYESTDRETVHINDWNEAERYLKSALPEPGREIRVSPVARYPYKPTGKTRHGPLGEEEIVEPTGPVFRGFSRDDWERIEKQGYIDSDERGAVMKGEGSNFASDPITAYYYLPKDQPGIVVAVKPDKYEFFVIKADSYFRTRDKISLRDVIAKTKYISRSRK